MFCDVIVFQVIMLVITIILGRNSKRKEEKNTNGYNKLEECKALWGSPDRVATLQI